MRFSQRDIVWVSFPLTDGSASKRRPALVLSNNVVNRTGDYILVQITSKNIDDQLSFSLNSEIYEEVTLDIQSYVRIHKIFILSQNLILNKATKITQDGYNRLIKSNTVNIILRNASKRTRDTEKTRA